VAEGDVHALVGDPDDAVGVVLAGGEVGTKRVHSREIITLQWVATIHLLRDAMMSGSAWVAKM
jgi:hypothetical protein